jgi:predicted dehydrogenase
MYLLYICARAYTPCNTVEIERDRQRTKREAMVYNIVLVGYGEIARLAHLPVLSSRSDTSVVGLVDINFPKDEVLSSTKGEPLEAAASSDPLKFTSVSDAFVRFEGNIHAFCVCTPKMVTLSVALECLKIAISKSERTLLGILLEKPPGDNADELKRIATYAKSNGVSMFTACHTAACPARKYIDQWLFGKECTIKQSITRRLKSVHIVWKESVRKWHPGQTWISTTLGGGVTDMLFNPLSLIVSLFSIDHESIRLTKAELVRPCNWESPVSGRAEFLITYLLMNSDGDRSKIEVPLSTEFAFDYEPSTHNKAEEIWDIEFTDSQGSTFTLTDGGAQAFIETKRMTTKPTAAYPLRPEYELLYNQFVDLLNKNRGDAPSVIDCTTLGLLKEITQVANYTVGPKFDF